MRSWWWYKTTWLLLQHILVHVWLGFPINYLDFGQIWYLLPVFIISQSISGLIMKDLSHCNPTILFFKFTSKKIPFNHFRLKVTSVPSLGLASLHSMAVPSASSTPTEPTNWWPTWRDSRECTVPNLPPANCYAITPRIHPRSSILNDCMPDSIVELYKL